MSPITQDCQDKSKTDPCDIVTFHLFWNVLQSENNFKMRQASALPKFFFTRVTVVGAISLFADPGSIAQKLLLLVCLAGRPFEFSGGRRANPPNTHEVDIISMCVHTSTLGSCHTDFRMPCATEGAGDYCRGWRWYSTPNYSVVVRGKINQFRLGHDQKVREEQRRRRVSGLNWNILSEVSDTPSFRIC